MDGEWRSRRGTAVVVEFDPVAVEARIDWRNPRAKHGEHVHNLVAH